MTTATRRRLARPATAALLAAVSAALAVGLGGCGGSGRADNRVTLTVLAASSLTDAADGLTTAYGRTEPGVRLRFSLAGSQELASQVRQGAPADVIVTADEKTMTGLGDDVRDATVVAHNRLTIVVGKGNPKHVTGLADLARHDVVTVLAAPQVPVGRYSRAALAAAGVTLTPASEEPDVRAVLTRVRLGEADAGIVYVTDARSAGSDVTTVPIPAAFDQAATYPAAVVAASEHRAAAAAFVRWLASPAGTQVLARSGFEGP